MNFNVDGLPFALPFLMLVPFAFYVALLYLIFRLLKAFESGVRAHERIADALGKSASAPRA